MHTCASKRPQVERKVGAEEGQWVQQQNLFLLYHLGCLKKLDDDVVYLVEGTLKKNTKHLHACMLTCRWALQRQIRGYKLQNTHTKNTTTTETPRKKQNRIDRSPCVLESCRT